MHNRIRKRLKSRTGNLDDRYLNYAHLSYMLHHQRDGHETKGGKYNQIATHRGIWLKNVCQCPFTGIQVCIVRKQRNSDMRKFLSVQRTWQQEKAVLLHIPGYRAVFWQMGLNNLAQKRVLKKRHDLLPILAAARKQMQAA